jgi:hypothetical protein
MQRGLVALPDPGERTVDRSHHPVAGFADPVDPRPDELRAWAYNPASVPASALPSDWDLLVANDTLATTLFELAMDPYCPARRFAVHCLHVYAGEALRPSANFSRGRLRRLRHFIDVAARSADEIMQIWAHNCRVLNDHPDVFRPDDWIDGGLTRDPVRLNPYRRR